MSNKKAPFSAYENNHIAFHNSDSSFIESAHTTRDKILILKTNRGLTQDFLEVMSLLLGGSNSSEVFPPIRDISYQPSFEEKSVALSCKAHPLHTDGSFQHNPPSRFLLGFDTIDAKGGGISTFIPVIPMLLQCPKEYIEALANTDFKIGRNRHEAELRDEYVGPILRLREGAQPEFRWRYDDQVKPVAIEANALADEAIEWIRNYLASTPAINYQAEPGDLILVPNNTYLHGRTELSDKSSERRAYRVWLH